MTNGDSLLLKALNLFDSRRIVHLPKFEYPSLFRHLRRTFRESAQTCQPVHLCSHASPSANLSSRNTSARATAITARKTTQTLMIRKNKLHELLFVGRTLQLSPC